MIELVVYGKPVAKQRPRKGRYGNFYTPDETKDFEGRVAGAYLAKYGNRVIAKDMNIKAYMRFYVHSCKADLDNLIKSTLDGFKKVFNDKAVKFIKAEIIEADRSNECVDIILDTYRGTNEKSKK